MRRHADLERRGLSHPGLVGAVLVAVLLAGCGGGKDAGPTACAALDVAPVSDASLATGTLRRVISADQKAIDALDPGDPLAARFRGAKARAEQALASFSGDPLRSGSMSPTATILVTTQRVVGETQSLRDELCE